jgi:ATPase subunit of ABC transporter with duplicated ATPase domains
MLELHKVSFRAGLRVLFSDLSFNFVDRRYGLVGNSGVGKTTLAMLLAGSLEPDTGRVNRLVRVTCVPQFEERAAGTVGEVLQQHPRRDNSVSIRT